MYVSDFQGLLVSYVLLKVKLLHMYVCIHCELLTWLQCAAVSAYHGP